MNMRILGRRKLRSLLMIIFLFILASAIIEIVFISSQKLTNPGNFLKHVVEQLSTEISNSTQVPNSNLASACLSRNILDNNEVKLHSNRSSDKQYTLTIGISTITRDNGNIYLMDTLSSLTVDQTIGNVIHYLSMMEIHHRLKANLNRQKNPTLTNTLKNILVLTPLP
ncbi:uncharacterized protein LOC124446535 [Xenia sp. Carnegie-2017]|uniref:uncharacterized protein LOC124446535 n=1 Tax=Xenia sp. Carnegie-2017 TaxID=2897299 RepID=UPI001F04DEB6|nr:uncharacterized protein LOC124446535 [Xenia sp. Carnegie-2017]